MKLLYGRFFHDRYKKIAELIPPDAQVLELCMGDAYLYEHYLKFKNVKYTGTDINPVFIRAARKKNIPVIQMDIATGPLPKTDYLILHASLYQFIPNQTQLVEKLLAATVKQLIISEPVINLSSSNNKVVAAFAKWFSATDKGSAPRRFDKNSFMVLFRDYPEHLKKFVEINGGRELIVVLNK